MQVCCQALAVLPSLYVHWTVAQPQEKDGCSQPRAPSGQEAPGPGWLAVITAVVLTQPARWPVFSASAALTPSTLSAFLKLPRGFQTPAWLYPEGRAPHV